MIWFILFIEIPIITLNGRSIIMTFLFDWMSLLFMGFVFIILFWLFFIVMIICLVI